jgi:hypothetical protein
VGDDIHKRTGHQPGDHSEEDEEGVQGGFRIGVDWESLYSRL